MSGCSGPRTRRLRLQDLARERLGLVQLAPRQQHQGQVVVGDGQAGASGEGLAAGGLGLVQLALTNQERDEIVQGLGVLRVQFERPAVLGDRLVILPLIVQRPAILHGFLRERNTQFGQQPGYFWTQSFNLLVIWRKL